MSSTSKRPTRKTNKFLSTADIENELFNSNFSFSDDDFDDSFHLSSSSSESDSGNDVDEVSANNDTNIYLDWDTVTGTNQKNFIFNEVEDIQFNFEIKLSCLQYFKIFMTDDLVNIMVTETNRNANQFLQLNRLTRGSRMRKWVDTTYAEMNSFIGLLFYMGLVKISSISKYRSKNTLYQNEICRKTMPRNRFELLLRFWHFANNETAPEGNRLYKIQSLLTYLVTKFKTAKIPSNIIAVDETMVPFRGRLKFCQYIPGKSHKYGVKLFKVCSPDGYTYDISIYAGKMDTQL